MLVFKVIKRYYDMGIYSKESVQVFVLAEKLTREQYKDITGEAFTA